MLDINATVINRDLNPYHSVSSSFFAGLAELGMGQSILLPKGLQINYIPI